MFSSFPVCNKTVDVGFIVDFSSTVSDIHKEDSIKDFIISTATSLDVYSQGSHIAYIPYSTWPGDYTDYQWFNNTRVSSMGEYNKTELLLHLKDVVQRDPDTAFDRGLYHFIVRNMYSLGVGLFQVFLNLVMPR